MKISVFKLRQFTPTKEYFSYQLPSFKYSFYRSLVEQNYQDDVVYAKYGQTLVSNTSIVLQADGQNIYPTPLNNSKLSLILAFKEAINSVGQGNYQGDALFFAKRAGKSIIAVRFIPQVEDDLIYIQREMITLIPFKKEYSQTNTYQVRYHFDGKCFSRSPDGKYIVIKPKERQHLDYFNVNDIDSLSGSWSSVVQILLTLPLKQFGIDAEILDLPFTQEIFPEIEHRNFEDNYTLFDLRHQKTGNIDLTEKDIPSYQPNNEKIICLLDHGPETTLSEESIKAGLKDNYPHELYRKALTSNSAVQCVIGDEEDLNRPLFDNVMKELELKKLCNTGDDFTHSLPYPLQGTFYYDGWMLYSENGKLKCEPYTKQVEGKNYFLKNLNELLKIYPDLATTKELIWEYEDNVTVLENTRHISFIPEFHKQVKDDLNALEEEKLWIIESDDPRALVWNDLVLEYGKTSLNKLREAYKKIAREAGFTPSVMTRFTSSYFGMNNKKTSLYKQPSIEGVFSYQDGNVLYVLKGAKSLSGNRAQKQAGLKIYRCLKGELNKQAILDMMNVDFVKINDVSSAIYPLYLIKMFIQLKQAYI